MYKLYHTVKSVRHVPHFEWINTVPIPWLIFLLHSEIVWSVKIDDGHLYGTHI